MAQTVCVLLDDATMPRLAGIAGDRSRALKHILRAPIVLLSGKRLTVQKKGSASWRKSARGLALTAALCRGGRRGPATQHDPPTWHAAAFHADGG
jgi:hypothetical protein